MDSIQPYLEYFSAHPEWALVFIFLIAFGEALLIIGLFVPSTVILVSAGTLVGTGHLSFWPVFWATAIGAIAGDQVSYWAGRLYGDRLRIMWPLNRYPVLVAKGEDFVREHGGKSIAIGRFVPGVKSVVPGIVGMLGMSQPFFVFVNVTSGIFWAAAHILPGMLLGEGLSLAGDLSGHLVVVLLVLLVVIGITSWLIRLLAATLSPYTNAVLRRLSMRARASNSRAMHRFGKAIQPGNPRATAIVLLLLCGVVSFVFFVDIVSGYMLRNAASNFDLSVATLMGEWRNAPADSLMIPLTLLAERPVVWAMGLAMALWLGTWRGWRVAVLMLATLGFAEFASINLNTLVSSPDTIAHGGFMSVATLMAGLVFGFMAVLASHSMGRWSKAVVASICGSVVVAIAYSRVYLGAEWLSGVLAAGFLALVLTSLFGMAIEAIPARRIRPLGLLGIALLAFVAMGAIHIHRNLATAEVRFAQTRETQTFTSAQWQQGAWTTIPPRRVDLAGTPEELFSAQWVGPLHQFETSLARQGWKPLPVWSWRHAFAYLDTKAKLDKLPPRPMLHQGLKAKLTMVLTDPTSPERRLVLRAFKANVTVNADGRSDPVFLISVTPEVPRTRFGLYAMPKTEKATLSDQQRTLAALANIPDTRVIAETRDPQKPALVLLARP